MMTPFIVTLGYYTLPKPDSPAIGMVLRTKGRHVYVITGLASPRSLRIRFLMDPWVPATVGTDCTRCWDTEDEYLGQVPIEMLGGATP